MLSLEPFAGVMGFPEVDTVLEEVGERTIGERNAASILREFGIATLGCLERGSSSDSVTPSM
jgi:hypothetical protein